MTATEFRNTADLFTKAYLEAALWASTDDNGEPLDKDRCVEDVAPETLAKFTSDCAEFQASNEELLARWYDEAAETQERAGHDYWLTRNRHGAGYWDRWSGGTSQGAIGKELTEAAHADGSCDLYAGDDGLIYA